jgi:trigger factor
VRYDIKILQILKRVVPEADDANIAEMTDGKYKTADDLKSELRRRLEVSAAERSEVSLQNSSLKALADAAEIDVPESMIERQYDIMRKGQDANVRRSVGQSLSEYLKNNNLSVDEYDARLRKDAEESVRNSIVLNYVAERDEISYTNDDLHEEILRTAAALNINAQSLADSLGKNKEEFAALAGRARMRNTLEHIISLIQVKEVDPTAAPAKEESAAEIRDAGDGRLPDGEEPAKGAE